MVPPTESVTVTDDMSDSLTNIPKATENELSPHTEALQAKFTKAKIPARVLFIQDVWYPLQGVMNLSSSLKMAGHITDVAVGKDDHIFKEIRKFKPHIIAMSSMTAYRDFMLRMTRTIKKKGWPCITLVGGFDSSFFPEIIDQVPEIDILCRGEGNDAMVELATKVAAGEDYTQIKNLWIRNGDTVHRNELAPFVNMNEKNFDDHDIYRNKYQYFKDIEFVQIMAGRGCPYRCAYCFNHKYQEMYLPVSKRYASLRDPNIVIDEIVYLKNKYGYKTIFFNDSTLGYNKAWLLEFCKLYKERKINLPFTINMCANEVTEEAAKALGDTGNCYLVRMGLETGDERFRKKVIRKIVSNEQLKNATNRLGENGVPVSFQFMLGLPGETFDMAQETLRLASDLARKDTIQAVNIFKPFPKLDLADYGVEIGQYDPEEIGAQSAIGAIGTRESSLHDCFRRDSEGLKIMKLARFAHVYMNFKWTRPMITKFLIKFPDNFVFRKIWTYSDLYYTSRHHINASKWYLIKYVMKYFFKPVR